MQRLLLALLLLGSAATACARRPEPPRNLSSADLFPILDVGAAHIHAIQNGTSPDLANALFAGDSQPCNKDRPCSDGSCCNKAGFCGYGPDYCDKGSPASCVSNCDAQAKCGKYSPGGKVKCPLDLCCSDYGYCGTEPDYCDANNKDHPCQKDFGGCQVRKSPSCGKNSGTATNGRRIAYYASWNTRNRLCNRQWPKHLKTSTFTHLIFSFASINPKTFEVEPVDPNDINLYKQFTDLKSSSLQTWIGIGGWEFSENHTSTRDTWSELTRDPKARRTFTLSAMLFMTNYGFQGLDLDWEYPSAGDRNGKEEDKDNYITLVRELHEAFDGKFGLSVAIPASFPYLQGFDPKGMEPYVDWFNLMSYDLHGTWDANYEGLGPYMIPHTSLVELEKFLLPLWFTNVDPKKINMGLARYGRGYIVKDKSCMHIGCEFLKGIRPGNCTNVAESLSNEEIRQVINQKQLTPEFVPDHAVKVIKWDDQWIAFDDYETFEIKKQFANDKCFGGVFIWTIDYTGRGSGSTPNLDRDPTGEDNDGQRFDSDVYPHQDIWVSKDPHLECVPPCTLILPPVRLPQPTEISWPPLVTTFLSIDGGQTGTSTIEKDTLVNNVITKVIETVITVEGATVKTITSTVSIPPFRTSEINFWPIYIEPTDEPGYVFEPVPSIMPPSMIITLPPGIRTFPPTPFSFEGEATSTSSSTAPPTPLWFLFGTTPRPWTIQPQPTVPVRLPDDLPPPPPDCPTAGPLRDLIPTCRQHRWPTAVTFFPFPPQETCDIPVLCGKKNCALFGCGCGPAGLPFGPGCNTGCKGALCDVHNDDDSDDDHKKHDDDIDDRNSKKDKKHKDKKDKDDDDQDDDNDDDDEDERRYNDDSGKNPKPGPPPPNPPSGPKPKKDPGDPKKDPGIKPPVLPTIGINLPCGIFGCGGGCGLFGCGSNGGCSPKGCGLNCVESGCQSCPLEKCGGPGCKNGGCKIPPAYPTGGPPNRPECEEEVKTTVTDYWISCTKFDQTSSSCTTTRSVVHSGCGITATKTTTKKGPNCTRAPLNLDDDQGDDNGRRPDDPERTGKTQDPKPTEKPDWSKRECSAGFCGCCLDYYSHCKDITESCKADKGSADCIKICLKYMCYNEDSPKTCHYGEFCGNQIDMCPEFKKLALWPRSKWLQADARMSALDQSGPVPPAIV